MRLGGLGLSAVLAATLALGGCNLVTSEKPVFFAADARGAPPFRPGIWVAPDPGCSFKESDPVAKWPQCAHPGLITATRLEEAPGAAQPAAHPATPDQATTKVANSLYILAAGDPRVIQMQMVLPLDTVAKPTSFYYFAAVRPTAYDPDRRIIAAEVWPIQCGPPPPKPPPGAAADATNNPNADVTTQPLPGMKVDKGMCTPVDKAAVLNAATPSRAWADSVGTLRWVRNAGR